MAVAASSMTSIAPLTTNTTAAAAIPLPVLRPPAISFAEALNIAYPDGAPSSAESCKTKVTEGARAVFAGKWEGLPDAEERANDESRIRCLLSARFSRDNMARDMALTLYETLGSVTGVITEHVMDGGFRGEIRLVPELPILQFRRHLQWVKTSFSEMDWFFAELDKKRSPNTKSSYRYKALALRFLRSVGRTTPSAYAIDWEVAYNVSGSLHANVDAVRETIFHEVFHLNDSAHGRWSQKALTSIVDGILAECGQKTACLTPYAPGATMVRGGTYYAFHKGNGVWEYAAELATRYYTEHRTLLRGETLKKPPFKCQRPQNLMAWNVLVEEFFKVDLTPPCQSH